LDLDTVRFAFAPGVGGEIALGDLALANSSYRLGAAKGMIDA